MECYWLCHLSSWIMSWQSSVVSLSSFISNNPMVKASPKIKLLFLFMWFAWSSILVGKYKSVNKIFTDKKNIYISGHFVHFSLPLRTFHQLSLQVISEYVNILLRLSGDADWILLECLLGTFTRFQNVWKDLELNVKNTNIWNIENFLKVVSKVWINKQAFFLLVKRRPLDYVWLQGDCFLYVSRLSVYISCEQTSLWTVLLSTPVQVQSIPLNWVKMTMLQGHHSGLGHDPHLPVSPGQHLARPGDCLVPTLNWFEIDQNWRSLLLIVERLSRDVEKREIIFILAPSNYPGQWPTIGTSFALTQLDSS